MGANNPGNLKSITHLWSCNTITEAPGYVPHWYRYLVIMHIHVSTAAMIRQRLWSNADRLEAMRGEDSLLSPHPPNGRVAPVVAAHARISRPDK